jgi:vancomycin resistance protein VanW
MSLRGAIRSASPPGLRLAVALARRGLRDSTSGARARLVKPRPATQSGDFAHRVVEITQEIKKSAFHAGKLTNIRLGAERMNDIVLAPGEILSFWKLVGRPSGRAGFEIGRSIRGGIVSGDLGGGLCQLSGIAYEAGLRAGLVPVERHPHSRDLYAEADRFTPLGLDATVVWPYKDLRLGHALEVPVQFRFAVTDGGISVCVQAPIPLDAARLQVTRVDEEGRRDVRVSRQLGSGGLQLVSRDLYVAPAA